MKKSLSKHEKGLSEHEKGLSESKCTENISQKALTYRIVQNIQRTKHSQFS